MKKYVFQRTIFLFLLAQALVIVLSFLTVHSISLLEYINFSFYIGGLFILFSLFFFVVEKGFFDAITKSFRLIFGRRHVTKKEVNEMKPPSQLISFNYSPFFLSGLLIIGCMLIALFIYFH